MNFKDNSAFYTIRFVHVLLALAMIVPSGLSAANSKPAKPQWVTPFNVSTDTGEVVLEWQVEQGATAELFRLTEEFEGEVSTSYVTGRNVTVHRNIPGDYAFRISTCNRNAGGELKCSGSSRELTLTVTEEIYAPYREAASDVDLQEGAGLAPMASASVAGGPDELRPGMWWNPSKSGHGWSFYWANRLAASSNPTNAYDLHGIWYTYEAKTKIIITGEPDVGDTTIISAYRPVVVTMQLVETGSNTFGGSVYIKRNGTNILSGAATVTFGVSETSATVNWNVAFKHETLADTDSLEFFLGEDSSPFNAPTDYSGLWEPTSGSGYFVIDNIGPNSEVVNTVFADDDGDPVWIMAQSSITSTTSSTSLCFYYVEGGYAPDVIGSVPSNQFMSSGCDYTSTASTSNRNGRRYFADPNFEHGRYWVNFTLPAGSGGNQPAGGSVSIGSSSVPAYFQKEANFHRIHTTNGNSCQIVSGSSSCNAQLTWFTDGDYPCVFHAIPVSHSTASRSLIPRDPGHPFHGIPVIDSTRSRSLCMTG